VQGTLDAGPVVLAEAADALHHEGDVLAQDRLVGEELAAVGKAGFGQPAQVEHQLDQLAAPRVRLDAGPHRRGQYLQEQLQIVRHRSS
jgi:hypothetical protein